MRTRKLPDSITSLVEQLQIVQVTWQGVPIQVPKFAVYAVLKDPVYDRTIYRNKRQVGLVQFGRYTIPILDPFRGNVEAKPKYVIVLTHTRGNSFGLYGYTADHVETDIKVPFYHGDVQRIVKDYV